MKTKLPKKSANIATLLKSFQADLLKIYGEHLQKIILFGSYARGDFREGSDIDLLLLFNILLYEECFSYPLRTI